MWPFDTHAAMEALLFSVQTSLVYLLWRNTVVFLHSTLHAATVTVDEGAASPASVSEPDVRLSPHPGSSPREPFVRRYQLITQLAWKMSFGAVEAALRHGTTRCRKSPAMPGNKASLPTTSSYVNTTCSSSFSLAVPTSACPGHYPRPLLLGQASCWLHWLEPTRIIGVLHTFYARANQEFPRSESSFVAALGWYCTPGYLLCEREPGVRTSPPFTLSILDQAYQPVWLVLNNDASHIPFLRSHSQPASGGCLLRLDAYPHYRPLYGLMSGRYHRAIAIDAHIVGEGLHLPSMTQLSRFFTLPSIPRYKRFRTNGSHRTRFSWKGTRVYSLAFLLVETKTEGQA
jgi:hypothetical protein